MRRVVSIWLPTLPTDRIRRHERAEKNRPPPKGLTRLPLVAVAQDGNTRILAAVDSDAAAIGLRAGMKLTQARILAGALTEQPADPAADAAELRRLAEWCLSYAPLAAPDPPDGLWIDAAGSTHLHGGEACMLRDLMNKLAAQGFSARAAMADTPGLAHAMARFAPAHISIAPPGQRPPAGLPDDYPVEALRLPPDISSGLRRMGLHRIDQITAIPRRSIARRFGHAVALRLDQAAGRVFEPIQPIIPEAAVQAELRFLEPLLTAEAFTAAIGTLTEQVCAELSRKGQGIRRADLCFARVDGSIQPIRIGTARAVRDPAHLCRLLTDRLETIDPGLGVEAMQLFVVRADRLSAEQAATSLFEEPETDLAPLLDRLAGRLGASRVYRPAPISSHVPERSVHHVPAVSPASGSWLRGMPRPVRILDPPQPIDAVSAPDQALAAFIWRRVRHRVRRANGPERIAGEWWRDPQAAISGRDYFHVEDEQGRRFWLFRVTDDERWFLHGFF